MLVRGAGVEECGNAVYEVRLAERCELAGVKHLTALSKPAIAASMRTCIEHVHFGDAVFDSSRVALHFGFEGGNQNALPILGAASREIKKPAGLSHPHHPRVCHVDCQPRPCGAVREKVFRPDRTSPLKVTTGHPFDYCAVHEPLVCQPLFAPPMLLTYM